MGSFFSNIHVLIPDLSTAHAVGQRIRQAILCGPYGETDDPAQADRNVIIAHTASPRWLVIYDEDADAPDLPELERLAAVASECGHAIAASVSDSDVLYLGLFADGKRVEALTFNPANRRHRRPKHEEWLRLLSPDQWRSFRDSFQSQAAFAEQPLETLSEHLGLDPDFVLLGYRYRDEMPEGPREHLRFRLHPDARFYTAVEEPPDLSWSPNDQQMLRLAPGETVDCVIPFLNHGGEGSGLTIAIPWSAEREQAIRIDSFRLTCADGCQQFELAPELFLADDDPFIRGLAFNLRFYPWIKWSPNVTRAQVLKIADIINRHNMELHLSLTGLAPGRVEFVVVLMPNANAREGSSASPCTVEVAPRA